MEDAELILLYDYYGDLLTDRQKEIFELRYNQDLSLGEIGQELGISRQGVHDNLSRTEALLKNMEDHRAAAKVEGDAVVFVYLRRNHLWRSPECLLGENAARHKEGSSDCYESFNCLSLI